MCRLPLGDNTFRFGQESLWTKHSSDGTFSLWKFLGLWGENSGDIFLLIAFKPGQKMGEASGSDARFALFFLARRREHPQAQNTSRPALLRLSDYLLANYQKGVRPVRDWRKPTTVSIDVIVYAILSVVSTRPQSAPLRGGPFGVRDHVRPGHSLGSTGDIQLPRVPVIWHRPVPGWTTAPTVYRAAQTRKPGSPLWLPLSTPSPRGPLTTCGSSCIVSW